MATGKTPKPTKAQARDLAAAVAKQYEEEDRRFHMLLEKLRTASYAHARSYLQGKHNAATSANELRDANGHLTLAIAGLLRGAA